MAQVLKDEIWENILKAALQEFYEKGYRPAAVREIAGRTKIPTGLMQVVYHYKGKEWAMMILHKLSEMYLSGIGL